jgi:thioesterase domain-containing protein
MLHELQDILYAEIPITQNIQVKVLSIDEHGLTLRAPLAANINHKGTVFAGSINAVATLAGWGLLWVLLHQENITAHIVLQDSQIHYRHAVQHDFLVISSLPEPENLQRFFQILRNKGMARLKLSASIREGDEVAVTFSGRYVAILHGN